MFLIDFSRILELVEDCRSSYAPFRLEFHTEADPCNRASKFSFSSESIQQKVTIVLDGLMKAKSSYFKTKKEARESGITDIDTIGERIDSLKAVVGALKKRRTITKEKPAFVTKVEGRAFAEIPVKTLVDDPDVANLSEQPLPRGSNADIEKYSRKLKTKFKLLNRLGANKSDSEWKFNSALGRLSRLGKLADDLLVDLGQMEDQVEKWRIDLCTESSAYAEERLRIKKIKTAKDISVATLSLEKKASIKEQSYVRDINDKLVPLGKRAEALSKKEIGHIIDQLAKEKSDIPAYRQSMTRAEEAKEEWRENDHAYLECEPIPDMVKKSIDILNLILERSMDEEILRKKIATTFDEIVGKIKDRKLIQATPEMDSSSGVQARVTYKDKQITHPAGSEKAFFTLAILTTLGHYFQMPVLIDEVANNLDQYNLPAFFNLAVEFKLERGVQYLLSIKETRDFDPEGWVKELADLAASYYGKRVILVERGRHRAAWLFYPNLTMIHDAQPKPLRLVFPNGFTIRRTDREDNKPPDAKEYSATKIPGTSEGNMKCRSCGAETTIDSSKKRIACPACGKKYEVIMEDKEWTWLWNAAGHTEFAARIKEIQGGPSRSESKQPKDGSN